MIAELSGGTLLFGDSNSDEILAELSPAVSRGGGEIDRKTPTALLARFTDALGALRSAAEMQHLLAPDAKAPAPTLRIAISPTGRRPDGAPPAPRETTALLAVAAPGEILATPDVILSIPARERLGLVLREEIRPRGTASELKCYQLVWATEATTPLMAQPEALDSRMRLETDQSEWIVSAVDPVLRIGRDIECEICVDSRRVSRQHARLEHREGKTLLIDTSRNGTEILRDGRLMAIVRAETVVLDGHGILRPTAALDAEIAFTQEVASGTGWEAIGQAADHQNRFQREGEYWTVRFANTTARMKDAKGLHALARLLTSPGSEVAAIDLVEPAGSRGITQAPTGPTLDDKAKDAYRARLAELQAERLEAEEFNDPLRGARAQEEAERLTQELSRAVGLGGRDRQEGDSAERARVTVTLRIRSALDRLEKAHPELGEHLRGAIHTGRFCKYAPSSTFTWKT